MQFATPTTCQPVSSSQIAALTGQPLWCKVCEHYGNDEATCASHRTKTATDEEAVAAVHAAGYMVIRPITGSTECPVLQQTVCPNRNCFNFGEVRFPTLGHSRGYCPCAWDQEIPAWETQQSQQKQMAAQQEQMAIQQAQYMAWLQAQQGFVPPPPPMTQEMVDSHFDQDQIEVENFIEERDENSLFQAQDEFAHAVAEDDWLDTQESIAAAEEYIAEKEAECFAAAQEVAPVVEETKSKSWDSDDEEMDYDEENIFGDEIPALTRTESHRSLDVQVDEEPPVNEMTLLQSQIDQAVLERTSLQSSVSSQDGWTSMPTQKKIRDLSKNIDLLQRELNDRMDQERWDQSYGYLEGETKDDWLYRMGQQEGKIPCICSFMAEGRECKHERNHGVGACKFLHISPRPEIRLATRSTSQTTEKVVPKQEKKTAPVNAFALLEEDE